MLQNVKRRLEPQLNCLLLFIETITRHELWYSQIFAEQNISSDLKFVFLIKALSYREKSEN